MALRDVKEYYYTMLGQYVETKNDLEDFAIALKDGHITEDQLEAAKEDVELIKENLDRIQYIMYLLELPNRKKKQVAFKLANRPLIEHFEKLNVDTSSIKAENESVLTHLRAELKQLKK